VLGGLRPSSHDTPRPVAAPARHLPEAELADEVERGALADFQLLGDQPCRPDGRASTRSITKRVDYSPSPTIAKGWCLPAWGLRADRHDKSLNLTSGLGDAVVPIHKDADSRTVLHAGEEPGIEWHVGCLRQKTFKRDRAQTQ
jgi:hypothetical protein